MSKQSSYGAAMENFREIVAVDIGGTNVRFCRAGVSKGHPPDLGAIRKYKVADYPGLADAWRHFAQEEGRALPDAASIAVAAPTAQTPIKLTNSHWVIDPGALAQELSLQRITLVNDFEAIAHGVTALSRDQLCHLFGPDQTLPTDGAITVLGPGTGLGVGLISLAKSGPRILATEGGHMDFAPVDTMDDRILCELRKRFPRVSTERVVSGPGLNLLYQALGALDGADLPEITDQALWKAALSGEDERCAAALSRLCMSYGTVAGDLTLAHGANCVVLAGSLTQRLRQSPLFAGFHSRFVAKGRYRSYMGGIPVVFADHPEFGLFGAAVAGASSTEG